MPHPLYDDSHHIERIIVINVIQGRGIENNTMLACINALEYAVFGTHLNEMNKIKRQ